jgi:hypothetical protein
MKQAHKKRPPRATANSPPVLSDMGEFYFINLENFFIIPISDSLWRTAYRSLILLLLLNKES